MYTVQEKSLGMELAETDMENVQKITQAVLFISRFYPKVRELRQFLNREKTA